jgi:hypothetical protein
MVDQRAPQPKRENRTHRAGPVCRYGPSLCAMYTGLAGALGSTCLPLGPPPWSARQPPAWPVKGPETSTTGTALGLGKVWVGPLRATRVAVENRDFLHWASEQSQQPLGLVGCPNPALWMLAAPHPHTPDLNLCTVQVSLGISQPFPPRSRSSLCEIAGTL